MSYNYVVTAQKPTAVTHAVTGCFTSPHCRDLILGKSTHLEIFQFTAEGLKPLLDVGIYGRISIMELFRPQGHLQDYLFLSTERYKVTVLSYDSETGEIVTRAAGDLIDRIGRPADAGHIGTVDPDCRLVGMHLYDGLLKVIPIVSDGYLREAFNMRLEELQVLDIKFLYGCAKPTLAILFEDAKDCRNVRTYEVNLRDQELSEGPWCQNNVESGASLLIALPPPFCGVLIIGEQTITYHNGVFFKSIAIPITSMKSYGRVDSDGSRYLLGDQNGLLYVLLLSSLPNHRVDIKLEQLGTTSIASCLTYLDNGFVFVGSCFGDSQLIRLNPERDENNSYVEIVDTFTNLGPIVDFAAVDFENQGQCQIVTCSGAFKDGSIRVIRNGIGINELASIEMNGIKGIWPLRAQEENRYDSMLVISFVMETKVLAMMDGELREADIDDLVATSSTLFCGNVYSNQILQVTPRAMILIDCRTLKKVAQWDAHPNQRISLCASNSSEIVVALGGTCLAYLKIQKASLMLVGQCDMPYEIACLDITDFSGVEAMQTSVCSVGLWNDVSVRLIELPSMKELRNEVLGGDIIPRSVLIACFEDIYYLFVSLGDGSLFTFVLNLYNFSLTEKKKLSFGTQAVVLKPFKSSLGTHVFACSDAPTVIYSSNQKLHYSNVNLKEVSFMCTFNPESEPNSLALASEGNLTIGIIDEIQKLHIRTIHLHEMPRRITHQPKSKTFGLLTVSETVEAPGKIIETCFFRLIDDQTYEILSSYQMKTSEMGCSIACCSFDGDSASYYVVGTAFVHEQEDEPTQGRILVFSVEEGRLVVVSEKEVFGAVYTLNNFNGKLLAGINSKVTLFTWTLRTDNASLHQKELVSECGHHGHILALFVKSRGDFIVVGDLMKSISLLVYKPIGGCITEIARDYNPNWMSAIEILEEDVFLGAENSFNLFIAKKNSESTSDEARSRLEIVGEYHLGEFVNVFQHGSLVMRLPDESEDPVIPKLLFGTVNGAIGVIASLSREKYELLAQVQENLNQVIKGVGGFSHSVWRSFCNERKVSDSRGFIDGDLIENFLELKRPKMQEVVKGLKIKNRDSNVEQSVSVEDLIKIVEDLARIH